MMIHKKNGEICYHNPKCFEKHELKKKARRTRERYTKDVAWIEKHEAASHVPRSEVEYLMSRVTNLTDAEARHTIAVCRKANCICETCGVRKPQAVHLNACAKCCLVFYCSATCQKEHWKALHKDMCCNPDASREMGFSRMVFVPLRNVSS